LKLDSLGGVGPATITPFTPNLEIEEDDLRKLLRHLLKFQGVKFLVCNADAGEGGMLTSEQLVRTAKIHVEEARGKVPIVAGIPGSSTLQTVQRVKDAVNAGADAVMILPPSAFGGGYLPTEVVRNHYAAVSKLNVPFLIFQIPESRGLIIPIEAISEACKLENVIGLKDASFNPVTFEQTLRTIKALPRRVSVLTGNDTFLFVSLLLGADGMLIVYANLATQMHLKMYEAVKEGDIKAAKEIDNQLLPLTNFLFGSPQRDFVARTKEALVMLGHIKHSAVYPPNPPISGEEKRKLKKILRDLGEL
jgi:4-hydroxy-tetrahydrodipicolinate synthase